MKNEKGKKMNFSNRSVIEQAKGWTVPKVCMGRSSYVSFSAFDPASRRMKRKKIMLDHLGSRSEMRRYGTRLAKALTEKLMEGWNPWIEAAHPMGYAKADEVMDKYHDYLIKQLDNHDMREQSVTSYLSYLNVFRTWAREKVSYVYQIDRRCISSFLDYVYVERNNKLQTRNNYLMWLKVFCRYLTERGYLSEDPTAGIRAVEKRGRKDRDVIPEQTLKSIKEWLTEHNRHYLLACYLLHYCFIRPHEMSMLRIKDFSLSGQTVFIHGANAKNHKDAPVTLPAHVIRLMLDLRVFDSPGDYYLFSTAEFRPGREHRSEKSFRDYWCRNVRKALCLDSRYKFYSLKDTGITYMLRARKNLLSVRDQARHSSIAITNIYTPVDIKEADPDLVDYEGVF